MAMTTRGTRAGNRLMEAANSLTAKPKPKARTPVIPKPLFPKTKMKDGETYRLPAKRGSRGKGTRLG